MDKKNLQEEYLNAYLLDRRNILRVDVWQDCPNTAAKVTVYLLPGQPGEGFKPGIAETIGFAKVSWPDEWDADFGRDLAIRKAIAKLAKRLSESG